MGTESSDRHAGKRTTVRIPYDVKDAAQPVLDERNWTMNDFIVASLVLVAQNPDAMLQRLSQFRPPPRRGRPKKA